MSCCNGNCKCGSNCQCGSGCNCNSMYPEMEAPAANTTFVLAPTNKASSVGGSEMGAENGGCGCTTCKCGTSCGCSCCSC